MLFCPRRVFAFVLDPRIKSRQPSSNRSAAITLDTVAIGIIIGTVRRRLVAGSVRSHRRRRRCPRQQKISDKMYIHVLFGVGQSRVFTANVRAKQLHAHIQSTCVGEFRRALATIGARVAQSQPVGGARIQKIREHLAAAEEQAAANAAAGGAVDAAQAAQLQALRDELVGLEAEQTRNAFLQGKVQDATVRRRRCRRRCRRCSLLLLSSSSSSLRARGGRSGRR